MHQLFQLLYRTDLTERKSLIVFDEVQLCPLAMQATKALVKDGRYDYIESGSLISIKNILIPSEEDRINMYPMGYEEFLWALSDSVTPSILQDLAGRRKSVREQLNRRLMRDF